eukprot:CAMPEP_0173237024 /NCGR_PEP_ID=MMETSP1142-20121109/11799_1 /TAXON_ID=483371 /ORGANISM="non described non described, Strain CCMP2298" /LENGTH=343 /DNA_ID=CAMNT_0014167625 /DNA_START=38 /DNA_END=1069 /DNA_ORIENTATION=-
MSLVVSLKMKSVPVTRLLTRCFATVPPMTKELLREGFSSKNASSLFLLDTSKFGLDMALADGLKNLGDFAAAEAFAQEAIDIAHHTEQSDNIYAAYAEGILAEISYKQGNFKDAADRFRHALGAYEDHYRSKTGPQSIKALGASQVLAHVYLSSHQYDKAVEALAVQMNKAQEVFGDDSLEVADTMVNLATTHFNLGNYDAAEQLYEDALETYSGYMYSEGGLASYTKPLQLIFTGLGDLNYLRGKEEEAKHYYEELTRVFAEETMPEQLMDYMPALKNLALIQWRMGDLQSASELMTLVRDALLADEVYGPDHPQTLNVAKYLADIELQQADNAFKKVRDDE